MPFNITVLVPSVGHQLEKKSLNLPTRENHCLNVLLDDAPKVAYSVYTHKSIQFI